MGGKAPDSTRTPLKRSQKEGPEIKRVKFCKKTEHRLAKNMGAQAIYKWFLVRGRKKRQVKGKSLFEVRVRRGFGAAPKLIGQKGLRKKVATKCCP